MTEKDECVQLLLGKDKKPLLVKWHTQSVITPTDAKANIKCVPFLNLVCLWIPVIRDLQLVNKRGTLLEVQSLWFFVITWEPHIWVALHLARKHEKKWYLQQVFSLRGKSELFLMLNFNIVCVDHSVCLVRVGERAQSWFVLYCLERSCWEFLSYSGIMKNNQ